MTGIVIKTPRYYLFLLSDGRGILVSVDPLEEIRALQSTVYGGLLMAIHVESLDEVSWETFSNDH